MIPKNKHNLFELSAGNFVGHSDDVMSVNNVSGRAKPRVNRAAITLLVAGGLAVLVFSGWLLRERLVSPFRVTLTPAQLRLLQPQTEDKKLAELKTKDTDGDGLIDYDEVYYYSTSPYLADSDSDGQDDKIEIDNGTDPNCLPGRDCGRIRLVTPDTKISDLFPEFSSSNISLRDKTLKDFRQILLDQGYEQAKLDQISDDALLVLLEETLKEQQSATTTAAGTIDYDQVRQFFIDLGVPSDEVYSLSNQEIDEILKTLQ